MQLQIMLCFASVIANCNTDMLVENIGNIVARIKEQFLSSYVVLFHPEVIETTWDQQLIKHLSSMYIMALACSVNLMPSIILSSTHPLLLVLTSDAALRDALIKVVEPSFFSRHTWLLVQTSPASLSLEDFTKGFYLPINSRFLVLLHLSAEVLEAYHVQSNLSALHIKTLAKWESSRGLQWVYAESFLKRRSNLQGVVIKAATIQNPPITVPVIKNGSVNRVNGFFGRIWRTLQSKMNFTTVFFIPQDGSWGARQSNGSWSGTVGMILNGNVEVAVTEYTLTLERASVVDYTQPLITTRFSVIVRDNNPESSAPKWGNFLAPFSRGLWCAIVVTIFLSAAVHYLFQKHFLGALFDIFAIFCQKGQEAMSLRRTSDRILNLALQLTAMVLNAAYSAALVSFLTAPSSQPMPPFQTLEELLQTDYTLAVLANSGQLNFFDQQADNNSLLHEVYVNKILPGAPLPASVEEGLQRLCEQPKYAFMTSLDIALALEPPCTVLELPRASISDSLAMTLRKDTPYLPLINYNLQILKESGVLGNLRKKTWPEKKPAAEAGDFIWSSIAPETVISAIILICLGCVLAILIFTLEICVRRLSPNDIHLHPYRFDLVKLNSNNNTTF